MAVKEVIEIEAKTDEAQKELEALRKDVQKLGAAQESTAKSTGKIAENLGNLTKGAVIGLAIKAFESFTEVLGNNQRVADFFSTTLEFVSIAFNDLVSFILNNTQPVVNTFKAIFDDPLNSIKDLGNAIKENLIERFNSWIETLGYVGSAVSALFKGNFSEASELATKAGKEMVDVFTGVDGSVDKISETVSKSADAVKKYTSETLDAASANVQLAKQADLAAVANQGLIEKYDLQATRLRQIRDDDRNSLEDRRKANNELAEVLDKQAQEMLKNAQIALNAANAELSKNKDNVENIKAKMEAENELAAVKAQIANFESEQQSNDLDLDREEIEMIRSKSEAEIEAYEIVERARIESLDSEEQQLQQTKALEQELYNRRRDLLLAQIEQEAEGTVARADLMNELNLLDAEFTAGEKERAKEVSDFKKNAAEEETAKREQEADKQKQIEEAKQQAILGVAAGALNAAAGFAEEGSDLAKGIAVAQATIGGIESTIQAYKSVVGIPVVGPVLAPIAAGVAAATTAASIRDIINVDPSGNTTPSTSSAGRSSGATVANNIGAPQFNTLAAVQQNRLLGDISSGVNQPQRAYVVSGDVTTAQELNRKRIKNASF